MRAYVVTEEDIKLWASRLQEINQSWSTVRKELETFEKDLIKQLIKKEDPVIRGKIQFIQEFYKLPETVEKHLKELERALPENTSESGPVGIDGLTGNSGL